jgi:hypothetical protein
VLNTSAEKKEEPKKTPEVKVNNTNNGPKTVSNNTKPAANNTKSQK